MPWTCCPKGRIATHCNTLQHTASHCITLQHTATHCNTLQHTATHCNTLQHISLYFESDSENLSAADRRQPCICWRKSVLQHPATHCKTLQRTTKHCNALQHTAKHCKTLQHTATRCNTPVSIPSPKQKPERCRSKTLHLLPKRASHTLGWVRAHFTTSFTDYTDDRNRPRSRGGAKKRGERAEPLKFSAS